MVNNSKIRPPVRYVLTLILIFLITYAIFRFIDIKAYDELIRNSIMFITISAGFYRSGLNVMMQHINVEKNEGEQIDSQFLTLKELKFYYTSSTYVAVISTLILIIFCGLDVKRLPVWLDDTIIPIIIVNAYCSIVIFRILIMSPEIRSSSIEIIRYNSNYFLRMKSDGKKDQL